MGTQSPNNLGRREVGGEFPLRFPAAVEYRKQSRPPVAIFVAERVRDAHSILIRFRGVAAYGLERVTLWLSLPPRLFQHPCHRCSGGGVRGNIHLRAELNLHPFSSPSFFFGSLYVVITERGGPVGVRRRKVQDARPRHGPTLKGRIPGGFLVLAELLRASPLLLPSLLSSLLPLDSVALLPLSPPAQVVEEEGAESAEGDEEQRQDRRRGQPPPPSDAATGLLPLAEVDADDLCRNGAWVSGRLGAPVVVALQVPPGGDDDGGEERLSTERDDGIPADRSPAIVVGVEGLRVGQSGAVVGPSTSAEGASSSSAAGGVRDLPALATHPNATKADDISPSVDPNAPAVGGELHAVGTSPSVAAGPFLGAPDVVYAAGGGGYGDAVVGPTPTGSCSGSIFAILLSTRGLIFPGRREQNENGDGMEALGFTDEHCERVYCELFLFRTKVLQQLLTSSLSAVP